MKYKIKCLILLLIFLLAITAVSANDEINNNTALSESIDSDITNNQAVSEPIAIVEDNSTNIEQSNNQKISVDENKIIGSSNNENVLNDEATSFKKLQELIDSCDEGSTIPLTQSYTFDSAIDQDYKYGIVINKTGITIDGGNLYSINGNNLARIFNITADGVTIKSLSLIKGWVPKNATENASTKGSNDNHNGGAIYWTGNYSRIINCTFTDNHIYREDGYRSWGASVFWYAVTNFTIINSTFNHPTNPYAITSSGDVFCIGSNVHVENSSFSEARCTDGNGAAVYVYNPSNTDYNATIIHNEFKNFPDRRNPLQLNNFGNITVVNNTFDCKNSYNGAIKLAKNKDRVNISHNIFQSFTATNEGIIYFDTTVYCKYVYIGHNTAKNLDVGYCTIRVYDSSRNGTLIMEYNNFTNISHRHGTHYGTVYIELGFNESFVHDNNFVNCYNNQYAAAISTNSVTYIENNNFTNCTLGGVGSTVSRGAAIHVNNFTIIRNNNFSDNGYVNTPSSSEGIIYVSPIGSSIIANNKFANNNVSTSLLDRTGVISNSGNDTIIENNTFIDSDCSGALGGVIYNIGNNISIRNNTMTNSIGGTGGVIYSSGDDIIIDRLNIKNAHAIDGGAIYIEKGNVSISNISFIDVSADNNYGVIYCNGADSFILNNKYTNASATSLGMIAIGSNITVYNQTIDNGHVTNGQAGVIMIMGDNNNLTNISIYNSSANTGGAIVNNGNYNNLTNFTINHTTATSAFGGALYSLGNNLNIDTFKVFNANASLDGGAIYMGGEYCTLEHGVFDNVFASRNGGVIFWSGNNGNMTDINITNAYAGGDGGAVYWTGTNGTISINVTNIHATTGGALYCIGSNCKLISSQFTNVTADSDGGAIYWTGSNANFTKVIFKNINSSSNGGAIFGTGVESSFNDLTFTNVNSTSNGGAFYWAGARSSLYNLIFNSTRSFISNGGALFFTGDKSSARKIKFENIASEGSSALYWTGSYGNLSNLTFINCTANGMGGALYCGGSYSNLTDASFINNSANSGGALLWNAVSGKLWNASFIDNIANGNGGGIYWIGNNAIIYDLTMSHNNATSKGGAVYLKGNNASFYNWKCINNSAIVDGGAVLIDGSDCTLSNSSFQNNTASTNGGALYWGGVDGTLTQVNFTGSRAGVGGAIYWSADNGNLSFVKFTGNNATVGGALYMGGLTKGLLINSTFVNNNASSTGGAIYWAGSNGNVADCIFNSSSARDGGALYWAGDYANLSSLKFNKVFARNNGGILFVSAANVSVSHSNFEFANATTGGAVYWAGANGILTDANFTGDKASLSGGAVYWIGNNAVLKDIAFNKNNASVDGGALYMISYDSSLYNVNFVNNSAVHYGGALYWAGNGVMTHSNFSFNRGFSGSAIYNAGTLDIDGSEVLNNKANMSYFEFIEDETNIEMSITTIVHGWDNFLNGIWTTSNNIRVKNVTYYGADGVDTSDPNIFIRPRNGVTTSTLFFDTRLAGIPINISYTRSGSEVYKQSVRTNAFGNYTYYATKFPSDNYTVIASHKEDNYYFGANGSGIVEVGPIIPDLEVRLNTSSPGYDSFVTVSAKVITVDEGSGSAIAAYGKVDIYVDDIFFKTIDVSNGSGNVSVKLPDYCTPGLHNISGHFYNGTDGGSRRIEDINSSTPFYFNVVKNYLPSVVNVSTESPVYFVGDPVNITISGPKQYTGNITYVAGDVSGVCWLTDGYYNISAVYNDEGTVNVLVFVAGDDNYLPSSASHSFNVIKRNVSLAFDNLNASGALPAINVSDVAVIKVNVSNVNASGNIIINVDGKKYVSTINNGTVVLNISGLSSGVHNISAMYNGDYRFNNASVINTTLTVNKVHINNMNISVNNSIIYVGDDAVFTIVMNSTSYPVNGIANVSIGGNYYDVPIQNNVGNLVVSGLTNGNYNINVSFSDDMFDLITSSIANIVRVDKINTSTRVSPIRPVFYVGEDATFNIIVDSDKYNVNGYVTVYINGTEYRNVSIVNGKASFNVSNLLNGSYVLSVAYTGDYQFNPSSGNCSFDFLKTDISSVIVKLDNRRVYVGQSAVFNVTMKAGSEGVTGYVTLRIDGNDYLVYLDNGRGSVNVSGFKYSEDSYRVDVYYEGDDVYNPYNEQDIMEFYVRKVDIASLNVTPVTQHINVGDDATFIINMTSVLNEDYVVNSWIVVKVGNVDYNVLVSNGTGVLSVSGLLAGDYNVYVSYAGDDIFNSYNRYSSVPIANVTVSKILTNLTVNDVNISVGDVAVIIARINNTNATGNVSFIVDGREYVVGIVDGVSRLTISGLSSSANGTVISAFYQGDYKFVNSSDTSILTVNKVSDSDNVSIVVSVYDIVAGDAENVVIVLPDISNGTFTVLFNGSVVNDYTINGNVVLFSRVLDVAGEYNVNALLIGDSKYDDLNASANFNVSKMDNYDIIVNVTDNIHIGDNVSVRVILPADAVNDTVIINGKSYNISSTGGFIVLDKADSAGTNVLNVTYGDSKYATQSVLVNYNVLKAPSNVSIIIDDYYYVGRNINFTAISVNSTGKITVIINDKSYIVNNNTPYVVPDMFDSGVYNVVVVLDSDSNFEASETSKVINIIKNPITITLEDITGSYIIGDTVSIKAKLSNNVTGSVIFNIGGVNYTVAVNGDNAVYNYVPLANGTFNVTAYYSGDNKFNPNVTSNGVSFVVNKIPTRINVSANSVYVGEDVWIYVEVNNTNVSGVVNVTVNGKSYIVGLVDGKGNVSISGLTNSTDNKITAQYVGDSRYNASSVVSNVIVNKNDINVVSVYPDAQIIYVGDKAVLTVNVSSNVNVNVLLDVMINGTVYNMSIINNTGSLNVYGLNYGDYNVNLVFNGDEVFNKLNLINVANINVIKVPVSVGIDPAVQIISVGENAILNITVTPSIANYAVNSFVTVSVNDTLYNVSIIENKGTLVVSDLVNGSYTVSVDYAGGDVFEAASAYGVAKIFVNKIPTSISMNDVNISVGNVAVIVARVNNTLVSGNVSFIVDNKEYIRGIVNGVATLEVYNLNTSANKTISARYSGDDMFINSSCTSTLTVNKVNNEAIISVYDIVAGESENVIITLPFDVSNGTITVKFNDSVLNIDDYTISNNVITFNRTLNVAGKYNVSVLVANDAKYNNIQANNTFNVFKNGNYDILVNVTNICLGERATVKVTLPADAYNGKVSVNGKNYTISEANNGVILDAVNNTGVYTVNVVYYGDDKYDVKGVSADYRVYHATSGVSIDMDSVFYVGDDINFTVKTVNSTGCITVIINNKEYYPSNNTVYSIKGGLSNATYNVIVKLDGDSNYNASSNSSIFYVIKKPVSLTLDSISTPVSVGDNVAITLRFNDTVTGDVIFEINNVNYTVSVDGDSVSYNYIPAVNGTFTVNAYYSGDNKFRANSTSSSISFVVKKIPTSVNLNVDSIYVGQDAIVNVEVINNEATGNVNITVNGKSYIGVLDNGHAIIHVPGLTENTTVYAYYSGDNKYDASNNDCAVVVRKVPVSVNVSPISQSIYVGQNALLQIAFAPSVNDYKVNGYVTIGINGTLYNVSVSDNMGMLNVSGLAYGNYDVDVFYDGSVVYESLIKYNASTIIVSKVDVSQIDVVAVSPSIYVGEVAVLNITLIPSLKDYMLNGFVTVNVDGKNHNVSISNNTGVLYVHDLAYGKYPVSVYYAGDDTYNPANRVNVISIFVYKVPVSVSITPIEQSVYVGDSPVLNISVIPVIGNYLVNGFITVYVNNTSYNVSIINNTGVLFVPNLVNGTYTVDVDYTGDDTFDFNYSIRVASIYVNKRPTSISMGNVTINVGDVAYIEAVVNESSVTGDVIFTVDNKDYVVGIVNGVARLNVTGLNTSANRTITARYSGDYKFINSSTTALLTVSKVYGNASIVVYPITAGETETIIIKLPNDITNGTITVKFNSNVINDYTIENNVISFNRTLQVSGDYSVDINVDDDCKYYDFHNSTSFHVYKVAPVNYTIVIEVNDTHVFEDIPVIITLPNDANETLSLSVDGDLVNASVNVINGVATYTIGNLSYGNHTISVSYGNDKYDDKTVTTNVFVAKIDSSISIITPEDARVAHDIIINLIPVGSTGNVTVTINNKSYAVVDRAIVNASELLEGNYTIVVNLDGDDNYLESTNSTTFIVSRNNVSMVLNNVSGELLVDSPIVLRVNFTENVTGSVIFNVNGMNYTVNITESDYAEYVWIPTAEGSVSVTALYSGNDTYYPSATVDAVNFVVLRNLAEFTNVIVNDIMVGDVEEIVVTLNVTDITGVIYININGTVFEANVEGGLAFLSVPDLLAGDYNVTVSYLGDRKYYAIDSYYESFTVSKYDSPIVIVAEDIMVLDDAIVNVSLPEEINDLITITVGDNSQNVVLVNGSASLVISNLSAGTYDVIVNYSGNAKYKANSSYSAFTVHRYNSTFDVNVSDVFWTGDDNNISVVLSDDATGNVTVSINGTDYVLPVVDGRVDFTVPELDPGDYEAIISYSGDYKYDGVEDSFNFTVIGNYPVIVADDVVKYYKGSERLRVNLTNVRGDKLANESVLFVINGVNYTRVTNDDGLCSLPLNLPSGEYEALIVYNSSKYGVVNKTVIVKILPTVVGYDLTKMYHNASQFYAYFCDSEGNALVNTTVTFNINGVFYNRTTNASGWAKLNINLPAGEYIITSYNTVTGEVCSNLITVLSRITENYDLVKEYRNGSQFIVCVLDECGNPAVGVNVTFNINGVFYTRVSNSTGYVKLNINLPAGEYIITTYYEGCVASNKITVIDKFEGGL